jgi:hypothetical protein
MAQGVSIAKLVDAAEDPGDDNFRSAVVAFECALRRTSPSIALQNFLREVLRDVANNHDFTEEYYGPYAPMVKEMYKHFKGEARKDFVEWHETIGAIAYMPAVVTQEELREMLNSVATA